MAYTAKDPRPPPPPPLRCVLYLRETKSWWCGEEGEKVSLKTHATARGVGKNKQFPLSIKKVLQAIWASPEPPPLPLPKFKSLFYVCAPLAKKNR